MANLNTAISPAPVVKVYSKSGQVITSYTESVTMSLADNPTGATLGGTTTVSAVAGVATFSNLTLDRSGKDFRLQASGTGLYSGVSSAFSIPTKLVVTSQPSSVDPDEVFTITVTAQDNAGNTDTRYSGFVEIEIYAASPGGGTLGGNLSRLAVSGVATFPDLTLDTGATYYLKLTARPDAGIDCYTPASGLTSSIDVGGYSLVAIAGSSEGTDYVGFGTSIVGSSITPSTFSGGAIQQLITTHTTSYFTYFIVSGSYAQNAFSYIVGNGKTLLSDDVDVYNTDGGVTTWRWSGNMSSNANMFTSATTYLVFIE